LTPAPGSISGTIRNATTNDFIGGVTVTTNPSTASVVTDAGGQYFIDNVPAGDYDVTANAGGYEAQTVHVIVVAGQNYAQNMNLTPFFPEIETNGTTGTANFVARSCRSRGTLGPTALTATTTSASSFRTRLKPVACRCACTIRTARSRAHLARVDRRRGGQPTGYQSRRQHECQLE
jgi:hypothetical protein